MMPNTMVIVRVSEASGLFAPAATGFTLTHEFSQGGNCGEEVNMTSRVISLRWENRLVVSDSESIRR